MSTLTTQLKRVFALLGVTVLAVATVVVVSMTSAPNADAAENKCEPIDRTVNVSSAEFGQTELSEADSGVKFPVYLYEVAIEVPEGVNYEIDSITAVGDSAGENRHQLIEDSLYTMAIDDVEVPTTITNYAENLRLANEFTPVAGSVDAEEESIVRLQFPSQMLYDSIKVTIEGEACPSVVAGISLKKYVGDQAFDGEEIAQDSGEGYGAEGVLDADDVFSAYLADKDQQTTVTFVVENTGESFLKDVQVPDDELLPSDTADVEVKDIEALDANKAALLAPGEKVVFVGTLDALGENQVHANQATTNATPADENGQLVDYTDEDGAKHTAGTAIESNEDKAHVRTSDLAERASVSLKKYIGDEIFDGAEVSQDPAGEYGASGVVDADNADSAFLAGEDQDLTVTFVVKNTGDTFLKDVEVPEDELTSEDTAGIEVTDIEPLDEENAEKAELLYPGEEVVFVGSLGALGEDKVHANEAKTYTVPADENGDDVSYTDKNGAEHNAGVAIESNKDAAFASTSSVENPTDRIDPNPGEVVLRITARTFDDEITLDDPKNGNVKNSADTRMTEGIRFRLWTASRHDMKTTSEKNQKVMHEAGPQSEITGDWATCVTDSTGQCDILIDPAYHNKSVWIVQETAAQGTYFTSSFQWQERKDFDPEKAYYPGWVNIPAANASRGTVVDGPYEGGSRNRFASLGAVAQSVDNPSIEGVRKCQAENGPKIALVMDTTLSITDAKGQDLYRDAVYGNNGFLDHLRGTGASVAAFSFAFRSPSQGINKKNHPELLSVDTQMDQLKANIKNNVLNNFGGVTRWTSGFEAVAKGDAQYDYDQIVFITDGAPNRWGRDGGKEAGTDVNYGGTPGIEAAVYRANELKLAGTRIVSIGVGAAETAADVWNAEGQLKAISGPENGVDYFGTDWDHLAQTLRGAAGQLSCQVDIEVNKEVVDADLNPLSDQSGAEGWEYEVKVDDIVSDVDSAHLSVPKAVLNPDKTDKDDDLDANGNPIVIRDTQKTEAKNGKSAQAKWQLTFYGEQPDENRADITVTESPTSKAGFGFVPGKKVSSGNDASAYEGSWYRITNYKDDEVLETGPITSLEKSFDNVKRERRLELFFVNQQVFKIEKNTDQEKAQSTIVSPREWEAEYEILLTNSSENDATAKSDPVFDTPKLPKDYVIKEFKADGKVLTRDRNGRYKLSDGVELEAGDTRSWKIEIKGEIKDPTTGSFNPDDSIHQCSTETRNDVPETGGLLNGVAMKNDIDGEENNWACIPVEFDNLEFEIGVRKVALDGDATKNLDPDETGWEFTLYEEGEDGKLVEIQKLDQKDNDRAHLRFTDAELEPGTYVLIETKSPAGYELLASPVRFTVTPTEDGDGFKGEVINKDELGGSATFVSSDDPDLEGRDGEVIIQVADVHAGTMPLTGGNGVQWYLFAGSLLILAAGAYSWRRRV